MKRLVNGTLIAFMMTMMIAGAAHAQLERPSFEDFWPRDVVGETKLTPPYEFKPDGVINYGAQNWWEDDTMACYNTYQNAAYMVYFPACDLNGSGVVDFEEVLAIYFTALDSAPAYATPWLNDCQDVGVLNFGMPSCAFPNFLGFAVEDGECVFQPGCTVPAGLTLFASRQDCESQCLAALGVCESSADCGEGQYCQFDDMCGMQGGTGTCTDSPQVCHGVVNRVCGCNNRDYANDCLARLDGQDVAFDGNCL